MSTKSKKRNESTVFLAVLLGILILVNILGMKFFARGDLTEDGIFTLSDVSVSLVENLEDKLIVKAYFTKNLPGRFATLERHVKDLLSEYAEHSDGKMTVEFIDPAGDEEQEKIAKSLGIQKMPNPDIEKDQATVKEGYRGISFSFGDETEVVPAVESPVGLEYQITSVIKKITGRRDTLGFVVGHGEPEISPPPPQNQQQQMFQDPRAQGAYRNIRNNLDIYNYRQTNLKDAKGLPSDIQSLVVAGTRENLEEKELYEIDQVLMKGGSIAFFIDGVHVNIEQGQYPGMPPQYHTIANTTNLRDLLKHYGAEVSDTLVMDAQAARYGAQCPPIPLPLPRPYPAWPLITAFDEDHPLSHRLGSLTMPYAAAVRITDEAQNNEKLEATEVAFSSGNSWSVSANAAVVDPCNMEVSSNLESSIPVAATIKGMFTSYFKGKELPEGVSVPVDNDSAGSFLEKSKEPGRIVVVGSAGLPADDKLGYLARIDRRQAINNFTFVQNTLDWMTSEENLIAVRMKNVDDPPVEKKPESVKTAAKYGNIIGIPFAFILFGLVRWRLRRKKSFK